MSSRTQRQSSGGLGGRGGRGSGRGRGRNNRNYKRVEKKVAPKYDGPMVGGSEWVAQRAARHEMDKNRKTIELLEAFGDLDNNCDIKFLPSTKKIVDNSGDNKYRYLQEEMMDNGWVLEAEQNGEKYFTHTTYRGKKFQVYVYTLSNNNTIMLPIVSQTEDVKGLGCSVNMKTNGMGYEITSNRWIRVWEGRKGKRTQKYNEYYNARQKKKKEYEELNKKA